MIFSSLVQLTYKFFVPLQKNWDTHKNGKNKTPYFQNYDLWDIDIDLDKMEARLTPLKVERVRESFREMKVKTQTTLRKLQSLIGLLNFACSVVVPGRAFLRRLIDLTCGVSKPHELIELTEENKARH